MKSNLQLFLEVVFGIGLGAAVMLMPLLLTKCDHSLDTHYEIQ